MSSRMTSCESVRALTDTTFALCVSADKYREVRRKCIMSVILMKGHDQVNQ